METLTPKQSELLGKFKEWMKKNPDSNQSEFVKATGSNSSTLYYAKKKTGMLRNSTGPNKAENKNGLTPIQKRTYDTVRGYMLAHNVTMTEALRKTKQVKATYKLAEEKINRMKNDAPKVKLKKKIQHNNVGPEMQTIVVDDTPETSDKFAVIVCTNKNIKEVLNAINN